LGSSPSPKENICSSIAIFTPAMLKILVATAATQTIGLRPSHSAANSAANFGKLRDFTKAGHMNVAALNEVAGVVNAIMLQSGNATEHLTEDDQLLLNRVIDMINASFYASMNSAHTADVTAVAAAIAAINQCYQDFAVRVGHGGDIAAMQDSAISYQHTLNDLQDTVDETTLANATAWSNLVTHIELISPAPECAAFPCAASRTMASLDVYFESSAYVTWWTAQAAAYWPVKQAWTYADAALRSALTAYAVGLAVRDVAYCDWKRELEAGCARFEACYEEKKAHYLHVVKPAVEKGMATRIEGYKAGETIIHQIKFLLAEAADQTTPSINTALYHIAFPAVPAKIQCDMSALDDAAWVPTPECSDSWPRSVASVWANHFSAFGAFDLNKIMKDYDDGSLVSIFNDKCAGGASRTGYSEYKGTHEIRAMFDGLFTQLGRDAGNLDAVGPNNGSPVVLNGEPPNGNVFLTWRTQNLVGENVIQYATDTFSFRLEGGHVYKILKQNIVVTEPNKACVDSGTALATTGSDGIYAAWTNHFTAFGGADADKIMDDYTADSLVQVYDIRDNSYTQFHGLSAIKQMFIDLFAAIGAAAVNGDPGVTVPLQQIEPEYNGVFLVWTSNSHPKATDTFVFDDNHKIIRQNIVVTSKDPTPLCRPGQDIISGTFQHFGHDASSSSDQECNERCESISGCTAWVRGRAPGGDPNGSAHCWLTQQIPPVWEADGNRVAGVPGCVMP